MKNFKLLAMAACLALFSSSMVIAQDSERVILTMSEFTIKQGHVPQFIEGVKKWKECYLENNGERKWNMWRRVQGEGVVFVMTGLRENWASFDEKDEVNKECYSLVLNFILPHVEKVHFNIARNMPDYSRTFPEDAELVWVTSFKVNNSTVFKDILDAVSSSVDAKEDGKRGVWYAFAGGSPETPDYMISVPFKGYADLDVNRDNVWKIYEEANGKEKAEEMRANWREIVDSAWSYMYKLNSELSN